MDPLRGLVILFFYMLGNSRHALALILANQTTYILTNAPRWVQSIAVYGCELDIRSHLANCPRLLGFLKYHTTLAFRTLVDIVIYDVPGRRKRFVVLYLLLSVLYNSRLSLRTQTNETLPVVSTVRVFQNANWLEREAWDMFGVFFFQHPDLRRLLTDYGFSGHPLRKDFPLTGYLEVAFSNFFSRILYMTVSFTQEMRVFASILATFRGVRTSANLAVVPASFVVLLG